MPAARGRIVSGQAIALTRDFHVFASRVSTRCSAVLVSIRHNAQAWYVCAHSFFWIRRYTCLLIRHHFFLLRSPVENTAIPDVTPALRRHEF